MQLDWVWVYGIKEKENIYRRRVDRLHRHAHGTTRRNQLHGFREMLERMKMERAETVAKATAEKAKTRKVKAKEEKEKIVVFAITAKRPDI